VNQQLIKSKVNNVVTIESIKTSGSVELIMLSL
jgi:hypothetical protein